jgi:tetratricopeptide (TPR) repeat protein
MNTPDQPTFINPDILARLANNQFVPRRQAKPSITLSDDRRDSISPLAITKRSIRYEPRVFNSRRQSVLDIATALNEPDKKIILLEGVEGVGKTALLRGVVELMGSKQEQLLWFDVNAYTQFDEIIHFFLQHVAYLSLVFSSLMFSDTVFSGVNTSVNPMDRLSLQIEKMAHVPLLLVLDNIEYLVHNQRFSSLPFKETLNFLLDFPNIKIILSGSALPNLDISLQHNTIQHIALTQLDEQTAQAQLRVEDECFRNLYPELTHSDNCLPDMRLSNMRLPWKINLIEALLKHSPTALSDSGLSASGSLPSQKTVSSSRVMQWLSLAYEQLTPPERNLTNLLAISRHPLSTRSLLALYSAAYPTIGASGCFASEIATWLALPLFKVLKRTYYPPQEMLKVFRKQGVPTPKSSVSAPKENGNGTPVSPWHGLYSEVKHYVLTQLSPPEKHRLHQVLQAFYLQEKALPATHRTLPLKGWMLTQEAKHHATQGNATEQKEHATSDAPTSTSPPLIPVSTPFQSTGGQNTVIFVKQQPQPATLKAALRKVSLQSSQQVSADQPASNPGTQPIHQAVWVDETIPVTLPVNKQDDNQKALPRQVPEENATRATTGATDVVSLLALAQSRIDEQAYQSALACLEQLALQLPQPVPGQLDSSTGFVERERQYLLLKGIALKGLYQHKAAILCLESVLEQAERRGGVQQDLLLHDMASAHEHLGDIRAYRQQHEVALFHFNQAIQKYQQAHQFDSLPDLYLKLASVYEETGHHNLTVDCYQTALHLEQKKANPALASTILFNMAHLHMVSGQDSQAITYCQQALRLDIHDQEIEGQIRVLTLLSQLFLGNDQLEEALNSLQEGLNLAKKSGSQVNAAMLASEIGTIKKLQQHWPEALSFYREALLLGADVLSSQSLDWLNAQIRNIAQNLAEKTSRPQNRQ